MSLRNALFDYPQGLWGDDNFLYICDSHNHRIRAINRMTNVIHTVAGGGKDVISSDSPIQATTGLLILPIGIWGDGAGNIYILRVTNTLGNNGPEVPFLDLRFDMGMAGNFR
jgi:sugar lactone lactonase YvrE